MSMDPQVSEIALQVLGELTPAQKHTVRVNAREGWPPQSMHLEHNAVLSLVATKAGRRGEAFADEVYNEVERLVVQPRGR